MRIISLLHTSVLLSIIVSFVLFAGINMAHAQADEAGFTGPQTKGFVALAETPGGSRLGNLYESQDLGQFINRLFTAALSLGAILAVLRLAFAGYLYMTTDAWGQKGKAKEVIGNVVLGLLLLLSIWLILKQINPQLLQLDFLKNIRPLPTPAQQR